MKNREILESIISLSVLNGLNMVLPLVSLPYLIRVVGLSYYGAYSIIYSLLQYVLLISQYGFLYSATQQIAKNKTNIDEINNIFNSTIVARLCLSFIASILFFLIVIFYNSSNYCLMYILGLGIVFGDAINPVWLFQGFEKMRYMTIVNVICKLIFTILIFVFIRCEKDYIYITLLNSMGFIFSGFLSLWLAYKSFGVRLKFPTLGYVKSQLADGWYIFISTLFMNLYRNCNVFILSVFVSESAVGMYAGAEKMIKAAQSVASPISNAFYPHFAKNTSKDQVLIGLRKLTIYMSVILITISILGYVFSPLINSLFLDKNEPYTIVLMKVMMPVITIGGLNYVLGIVGLVNLGEQRNFTFYVLISGISSVLFLLITINIFGVSSAAWAMVLSELLLCIFCVKRLYVIKKSLN